MTACVSVLGFGIAKRANRKHASSQMFTCDLGWPAKVFSSMLAKLLSLICGKFTQHCCFLLIYSKLSEVNATPYFPFFLPNRRRGA